MIMATSPRRPSDPRRFNKSDIFLYTSPTNGASGPNIIPSNKATETTGTRTSVNLTKKSFIELKIVWYQIIDLGRLFSPFPPLN